MRQPSKETILGKSSQPQSEFSHFNDLVDPPSSYLNILDQAFIMYSDEELISSSLSIYSHASFTSRDVNVSQSDQQMEIRSQKSQAPMISSFINNEESSIYDVRQSECSQSGKELLHAFQPLFKQNVFRRRSPRFATYEDISQNQENSKNEMIKVQNAEKNEHETVQMIEDEKSPLNQATYILQEKEEQQFFMNNARKENQKDSRTRQFRMTRSKTVDNNIQSLYKGNDTTLDDSQLPKDSNSNDYLSQLTKDYILTARKQKKIKKAQKQKSHSHNHKAHHHHYSLRKN